jgi:glycosyltransferase EpsE
MKKVSVILSAYNSEKFLERALKSILEQSMNDFQLILTDDGSSDATREIISDYSESDSRIYACYNDQNMGLTANLNHSIRLSKAPLIARMDADDIALPFRLERQVTFLEENPTIDILGSAAIDIDENENELQLRKSPEMHEDIIRLLPKANPMTHSSVMFRRESLAGIGFYNESYRTTQDYEMWFRAAAAGLKFHNLEEVLLHYRMDDNYHRRKSFRYRMLDCKLRLEGFRHIGLPIHKYHYSLIPLILGLLPGEVYDRIKKLDPRVFDLD